ncbi:hypothetical protein FBQ85_25055 [Cytophagia bacterium CHB2]|nr:hypothetical protein [Cytophagia bacterium CHB2]
MKSQKRQNQLECHERLSAETFEKPARLRGGRGLPADADFLRQTASFWQQKTGVAFSQEEARETVENLAGFFRVLAEWENAENSKKK